MKKEKRKLEETAEKDRSKQAKISAVGIGLAGRTRETRISEPKIYEMETMDVDM
jgi:hypothetical protein